MANWDFYSNAGGWWATFDAPNDVSLADGNVLNLTFTCYDNAGNKLAPPYPYNADGSIGHKLPYAIVISMDVVDSRTLARLAAVNGPATAAGQAITKSTLRTFSTTVYLPNTTP